MNKPIKIYVVGLSRHYARFIHNSELVYDINQADVILFTGGEDVDPNLYGERTHPTTYCNPQRDAYELDKYSKSLKIENTLRLGICRGCQWLTVMNGGKLVQDVTNHAGRNHQVLATNGMTYSTSSCHHQMAYPYNMPKDKYEILAHSVPKLSQYYEGSGIHWQDHFDEVEVIYFPETNSLGVQGHPEMMDENSPFVNYINELIIAKLNK